MKNQYFAYTRVSTAKQGEGASLEAQKDAIERYAQHEDLSISTWFSEKETAARRGRPQFNKLVQLLKDGKAVGVVIHKIDRSARNMRDWATVNELLDSGVDVRFAADSLDLTTRSGRLTAGMLAVLAEDYVRNLNEEREKGFNARLKQGLYPLKAPIGYLDNGGGKAKTICPVQGPKIVEMFELYSTGQFSMEMLADEMFARGLRSKHGGKIYKSKVDRILRDPFYIGMIKVWSTGYLGPGIHDPLISTDLFERVIKVRNGRTNRKKTKHNFVFRQKVQCSSCSRYLIGEKQRGHTYYRCHVKNCTFKTIREERLNEALEDSLEGLELGSEAVESLSKRFEQSLNLKSRANGSEPLCIQQARLREQKGRLTDAYVSGLIDQEALKAKQVDLLVQENRLVENAQKAKSEGEIRAHVTKILEHLKSLVSTYLSADSSEKRQLLEIVYSNISIAGESPVFETKKWLAGATILHVVPNGGPSEDTHRSRRHLTTEEYLEVIEALSCPDAQVFCRLCDQIRSQSRARHLPETPIATVYRDAA